MDLNRIFDHPPATPQEILQSRVLRAVRQAELLQKGHPCLISFTLNIPGATKQFSLAKAAFSVGLEELRQLFRDHIVEESCLEASTGNEGLLALSLPPEQAKRRTLHLEAHHPLGRLFDLDVLDKTCRSVSRAAFGLPPRQCLLCKQSAKICARAQTHSPDAVLLETIQILNQYFRDRAANEFAAHATRALLYEVSVTPKPGLVDRTNSGSHRDMNFFTFLDSSAVLSHWFRDMVSAGWDGASLPPAKLFSRLRFLGRQAERDMFSATHGINTHKGLIFSLGLLCGALGAAHSRSTPPLNLSEVLALCRDLGQCAMKDFASCSTAEISNGLSCFYDFSITGVRGEASAGFPGAVDIGLPSLRKWTSKGLSINNAAAITLVELLAETTDTNMIHRGGIALAQKRRDQARDILAQLNPENFQAFLEQLDKQYIQENLSPGGCADLLAISLMLFFLEEKALLSR